MNRFAAEIVTGACMFAIGACAGAAIEGEIKDRAVAGMDNTVKANVSPPTNTLGITLSPTGYTLKVDSCRFTETGIGAISEAHPCTLTMVKVSNLVPGVDYPVGPTTPLPWNITGRSTDTPVTSAPCSIEPFKAVIRHAR